MNVEDSIKNIRQRCRLAMNGVVSTAMREHGLNYKLNFGVSLPKIKEIAHDYQPSKNLAMSLWAEDVRELKILATLLFPLDNFTPQIAERWVEEIPNQEIREQICVNLFQNLPFAEDLALSSCLSDSESVRATGYWLYSRILILKKDCPIVDVDALTFIFSDIKSKNVSLRNAAVLLLKNIVKNSKTQGEHVLVQLSSFRESSDLHEKEVYDSIEFEYEFYNENKN